MIATNVHHGTSYMIGTPPPVRTVELRPGAEASFELSYGDVQGPDTPCVTATSIQITPPGDTGFVVVSVPGHYVRSFQPCGDLILTAVYAGTGRASS